MLKIDPDDNHTMHLTRGDRCTFRVYLQDAKTLQKFAPRNKRVTIVTI